jgi:1-deoxy-D-xylulose-5-phosphate synthase
VPLPADPHALAIGTGEILREAAITGTPDNRSHRDAPGTLGRESLASGTPGVALIGYGSGVGKALEAADLLAERDIDVTVADARFAKPIDAGLMAQLAAEHDLLVTIEEGVLAGGFGSAVWETLNDSGIGFATYAGGLPRIMRVGLPDHYVAHGKPALLHEEVHFTGERIAERVEAAIRQRSAVALAS